MDIGLVLMDSGTDIFKSMGACPFQIQMHFAVFVEGQTKMILIDYWSVVDV
jgi:hypothetical protein